MNVTIQDIRETIRGLDLSGHPVCVHSSLRSFGWVDGGASVVVDGLLAGECSVLVPTFSWTFAVPPPPDMRLDRNGWDYDKYAGPTSGTGRLYTPDSMEIDRDMGAIPASVLAVPQRVRGNHPLCSFTADGPLAVELISGQKPLDVFAPLKTLAEANGSVVLMGVSLERMTLIHLAERMAGRNMFRRWANGPDGQPMAVEVGGCGGGFDNFRPTLSPLMREARVGQSVWRIFPAERALEVLARAIRKNPWMTHCGDPKCDRCNDAVMGGPVLTTTAGA